MTLSLVLACLWAIVANVVAMMPSKDNHWRFAYAMIALGLPLLAWVWVQNGPWIALIVLVAGMWVLRWPVRYGAQWIGEQVLRIFASRG
ncbi:DUF2484 family protein [Pseudooceanicola atlanticus]|uniref:UDP-N-acetylmuramate--alanine ligase n=1 Tax=Pseudooceanicola atlanticus TaxID=1461694 RepID=A0A0A0EHD2_9RHOB|nr:DUF2484 family protein [Pseudooceanicola atlanticus]KGM48612.1 hypothetical protein ATO9_13380 [Pseudooceanicola atlanticus]